MKVKCCKCNGTGYIESSGVVVTRHAKERLRERYGYFCDNDFLKHITSESKYQIVKDQYNTQVRSSMYCGCNYVYVAEDNKIITFLPCEALNETT